MVCTFQSRISTRQKMLRQKNFQQPNWLSQWKITNRNRNFLMQHNNTADREQVEIVSCFPPRKISARKSPTAATLLHLVEIQLNMARNRNNPAHCFDEVNNERKWFVDQVSTAVHMLCFKKLLFMRRNWRSGKLL